MVKLTLTGYMNEVKGTLEKIKGTFRVWEGRQILEKKPVPTYVRTKAQDKQRRKFKEAIKKWKALTQQEKEEWRRIGNKLHLTGYQAFMSYWLPKIIAPDYKVIIDNTQNSNTLSNYQVLLQVNNDRTFFETFLSDHKYLEVYDSDLTTLLSFWVEEWNTTNYRAKIWIKVPTIQAKAKKEIFLRCNEERTQSLSNGVNTFVLFDDFEAYTDGSDIHGQGGWITKRIGGTGEARVRTAYGRKHLRISSTSYATAVIRACNTDNTGYAIRLYEFADDWDEAFSIAFSDDAITAYGNVYNGYEAVLWGWQGRTSKIRKWINGTGTDLISMSDSDQNFIYHLIEFRWFGNILQVWRDGLVRLQTIDTTFTTRTYIHLDEWAGSSRYIDWILVRRFTIPEPTVTYVKL